MPTVTVSLDDGTQLYQIGFSDPDWATVTAQAVADRANSIVDKPAVDAVPAVLDDKGNVVTPEVPAVPAVLRDPTANEAMSLKMDDHFSTLVAATNSKAVEAAVESARQSVTPVSVDSATLVNTLTNAASSISVKPPIVASPPIKVGPAPAQVGA